MLFSDVLNIVYACCWQYKLLGQALMVWRIWIYGRDTKCHTYNARIERLDRQKVISDFWTFVRSARHIVFFVTALLAVYWSCSDFCIDSAKQMHSLKGLTARNELNKNA